MDHKYVNQVKIVNSHSTYQVIFKHSENNVGFTNIFSDAQLEDYYSQNAQGKGNNYVDTIKKSLIQLNNFQFIDKISDHHLKFLLISMVEDTPYYCLNEA